MCKRETHFALSLYCVLDVFLSLVFLHFSINYLLDFQNAWALWIPHCSLDEVPHLFAFLSIDFLFNCCCTCLLFFSIAMIRQLQRCTFLRPFACLRSSAFLILASYSLSCNSSIVSSSGLLICCPHAKRRMFLLLLLFPSFILMSWR